jgi:hypothetical protein
MTPSNTQFAKPTHNAKRAGHVSFRKRNENETKTLLNDLHAHWSTPCNLSQLAKVAEFFVRHSHFLLIELGMLSFCITVVRFGTKLCIRHFLQQQACCFFSHVSAAKTQDFRQKMAKKTAPLLL